MFEEFVEPNLDTPLFVPPEGYARGLEEETEETREYLDRLQPFGNVHAPIPMAEWSNYEDAWKTLRPCVKFIFDQKQEPSCAANSQAQCMQTRGFIQYGDDFVMLSAASLYHRTRLRGGGSYISSNLKQCVDPGILPLDNEANRAKYKHVHPARGENRSLPNGWKETAKLFQVESYLRVTTPEEWFTALAKGYPINYGRDGHAIASIFPIKSRGNWVFGYANSWHERWGDKGFGYDSLGKIRRCTGYAIQSITVADYGDPVVLNESQSDTKLA